MQHGVPSVSPPTLHPQVHTAFSQTVSNLQNSGNYLEKECNDVAVCRVRSYGRSSMVRNAARMRFYLWLETQWKRVADKLYVTWRTILKGLDISFRKQLSTQSSTTRWTQPYMTNTYSEDIHTDHRSSLNMCVGWWISQFSLSPPTFYDVVAGKHGLEFNNRTPAH
jgi:hypothetical protein